MMNEVDKPAKVKSNTARPTVTIQTVTLHLKLTAKAGRTWKKKKKAGPTSKEAPKKWTQRCKRSRLEGN